jgi:hypothetical protein
MRELPETDQVRFEPRVVSCLGKPLNGETHGRVAVDVEAA